MVNCLKFGLVPDAQVYLRILLHHISKYIRIHVHTHIYYTLTTHMCAYANIHTPDYQYMYVYNYKINTYIHSKQYVCVYIHTLRSNHHALRVAKNLPHISCHILISLYLNLYIYVLPVLICASACCCVSVS
jgi:hypothetical protein